jgi:hypothetical protein
MPRVGLQSCRNYTRLAAVLVPQRGRDRLAADRDDLTHDALRT